MSIPFNSRARKKKRQQSALDRLEKDIKKYTTENDKFKLEKSIECAANLKKKINGITY